MKYLSVVFAVFLTASLAGQKVSYCASLFSSQYTVLKKAGYIGTDFQNKLGWSVGLGVDSLKFIGLRTKLEFRVEHYGADFRIGGKGAPNLAIGTTRKTVLGVTVYPIQAKLGKARLMLGPELSALFWDKTSGEVDVSNTGKTATDPKEYSSKAYFGFRLQADYPIGVGRVVLVPKYFVYYGLSPEFTGFKVNVSSVRHGLGIAIIP